ncbi:MAG: ATP-binding protein [Chloroflexota bacterium]
MSFIKRSIRLKLILSYAVIALLITVALSLFARWNLTGEVRNLLRLQAQLNLESLVIDYYQDNGSLDGFGKHFGNRERRDRDRNGDGNPPPRPAAGEQGPPPRQADGESGPPPRPADGEQGPPHPAENQRILGLANADGTVIMPMYPDFDRGDAFTEPFPEEFQAVEFGDEIIAYLLVSQDKGIVSPPEAAYLQRANIAFGIGSSLALLLAIVLGFLMSRNIVDPLSRLTEASNKLASGEYSQAVAIETEDEVGRLAVAFNQMSADLAEATRLRKQMTADIAHDLRSPLAVISGYIESMRDEVLQPTTARFDTIYSEIEHLQHLIEDLRTLSRADAGELPLNLQRINPQELIDRTISTFRLQAQKKNIELEANISGMLPNINGDEERLAQVLGNLVNNAIRHTPEDGSIKLNSRKEENGVVLTVEDSGEGIPLDALPHVFDRFYRVDEARQQNSGESGLGLAIAKSLIEAHGGTIDVFSRVGFGTRFDIFLPALAA